VKIKVLAVVLIVGLAAFLTEPHGPWGTFWPPAADVPDATGNQIPLFMVLGMAEALVCGCGVAFLLFGFSTVRHDNVSPGLARATHLAITWMLVNWWAHDSMHLHVGMDLSGLLKIEYGFHLTLIAAGLTVAWFFLSVARRPAPATR
jgi:hypothetical protein